MVNIIDTAGYFLENYDSSVKSLRAYYGEYPEIFEQYFAYHCKDTDERHQQSIRKYPEAMAGIEAARWRLPSIIEETALEYERLYGIIFPIDVNLLVGGFGSNAYTYRDIIPNISFALEKLSPEPDHLRALTAHEFGHAAHHILTDRTETDWNKIPWTHPLNWLYQEGVATHFSRKTAPGLDAATYYSFNGEGAEWLHFAEQNTAEIKHAFKEDYRTLDTPELFKEWFSINGGKRFGYERLAYFLGNNFFQSKVEKMGELMAVLDWREDGFLESAELWLEEK
ncbi:hypothetical protein [Planococcus sp. CAU13]|uniref:hypothetical protein n=1 Tax=Planococcus sp. CAU13 TaxID=1541197 RepID=UPI00052FF822|nr:hypothetical protein [Planococcus sp. CAU13]